MTTIRNSVGKIMTTKTKKSRKNVARSPRIRDASATNLQQTRYLFAPIMQKFRDYLRKDVANLPQIWLPIECNLLFRYEFATLSPQIRYIFVAILLYCGSRGTDEIPINITFLASALAVDARMLPKALEELEFSGLLVERKKEREEKKDTDRQRESAGARVSVDDFNSFQNQSENENGLLKIVPANSNGNSKHSQFTIEECLKYVEACQAKGEQVQSPKALASKLHKTGEADSFIKATLYPEQFDAEQFGNPTIFSDEPCIVCFGAKLADTDGKGYRACPHCANERGKSTGYEPERGET